jgi:hypothetical protein
VPQDQPISTGRWITEIPFEDLVVGAAYPCHQHPDEEVIAAWLRVWRLFESQ